MERGGRTVAQHSQPTRQGSTDELLAQLMALIERLIPNNTTPAALGVSVAAAPDPRNGRLNSVANIQGLEKVPLGDLLRRHFAARGWTAPIVVRNDAELAAMAEGRLGAAVGLSDFVSITIGTGIGMGIVMGGAVTRGWRGMAGEIAFLPVWGTAMPNAEADAYEGLVGGRTLAARCAAEIEGARMAGETTRLDPLASIAKALELAEAGDPAAGRLIDRECRYLALGVATVCALIDPQLVVLSGGIGSQPGLAAPVRGAVATVMSEPPPIETSTLGERAPLLGALEAARDAVERPGSASTGDVTASR